MARRSDSQAGEAPVMASTLPAAPVVAFQQICMTIVWCGWLPARNSGASLVEALFISVHNSVSVGYLSDIG